MLLIYTPIITSRIKYIFKLFFEYIIKTDYRITNDIEDYNSFNECKINYSKTVLEKNEIHIIPAGLLFETKIKQPEIIISEWKNIKIFFKQEQVEASLPFDPFAASFYLVSRFEEYIPHLRDNHNRYKPNESLAFQHDFLQKPMINIWANILKNLIISKYPHFVVKKRDFNFILTFDVDIAYAHKYKGFVRNVFSILKLLKNLQFSEIALRIKTILGYLKDPYDTFDYLIEIQKANQLSAIYFLLMADYGTYDKNLSHLNNKFQSLIKHIADYAEVGIHSSYASNLKPELIQIEVDRLKNIVKKEVSKNRQHFLMLDLPYTYRNLIEAEITDDYTMGYASEPGFRASICTPFLFYNLNMEYETNITIHPFAYMEGTFANYKKMSPSETLLKIKQLIDEVKAVDGDFISLWHNHSLCDEGEWRGWKKVFEDALNYAVGK